MKRNNKIIKVYVIIMFITAVISWLIPVSNGSISFKVNYDRDIQSTAQIFYNTGDGYTENDSAMAVINKGVSEIVIDGETIEKTTEIRLDPVAEKQDDFKVDSLQIYYDKKKIYDISSRELRKYVTAAENADLDKSDMKLGGVQDDPNIYFSASLVSDIKKAAESKKVQIKLSGFLIAMGSMLFILICFQHIFLDNKMVLNKLKHFAEKNRLKKTSPICYFFVGLSDVLLIVFVILYTVKKFLIDNFNGLSFSEIVFHLKVPMEGTSTDMLSEYFKKMSVVLIAAVILLAVINIFVLKNRQLLLNRLTYIITFCSAVIIFFGGGIYCLKQLGMMDYIKSQMESSKFIEKNYVKPDTVSIKFPEKKRNLIYIYMESMESTFISKAEGGAMDYDIIPELTKLAQDNTNFSEDGMVGGSYAAYGSTWTVGAMVAQTSGLPLLLPIDGNSYGDYEAFMPGTVSLGDILKKEGYNQEIMVGSDISFGGRGLYFSQHGNYKLWDYSTAIKEGKIADDYYVWWGYEDKKLYEYAKDEITKLADKDEPFNFTMLTVDTHHIGGYKCDLCGDKYSEQYENVLACASNQVNRFVKWLQKQDFYENTTIIISGDHPTMDNVYMDAHYDGSKGRRVYNCIINSVLETSNNKNRKFTSMDLFPTTLAVLGADIEGDKLGLGTNLYSDKQTLAEQYGYEYIDKELAKNSKFYNKEILGE